MKLIACLDILLELSLGRRVLTVLEIDGIEDVGPGSLVTIDTLRRAVALSAVELWESLGLNRLDQTLWCRLARNEDFGSNLRGQAG